MKGIILVFSLVCKVGLGYSQNLPNKSIELFVNPLVSNSNLFKSNYIVYKDQRVDLNENYTIKQEIGVNFFIKPNKVWNFGVGLSYKNYNYSFGSTLNKTIN